MTAEREALVALADAADKCSEAPHFIVQPFLSVYRKHGGTIARARQALANPAVIRDTDEDAVEADMRAYAEAAMQHGWKTAVDAVANGRLVDGWERDWFEQNPPKCARLASSTPAEPREASGYCPFCMTADPVAPAEGDEPTAEGNYDERN